MSRLHPILVWTVWAGMTALAGLFVARFGGRVPMQDDFLFLRVWLNPHLPDAATLWEQLNEHRVPLPRLVSWVAVQVVGLKLRNLMALDLVFTSALAAALIVAARRYRGHTHIADAFFPLVLLTIGQSESLLWAVQINFFLPVWIQGVALILLCGVGEQLSPGRAVGLGLCAVALPLCGMQGIVTGAALGVWLLYAGWRAVSAHHVRSAVVAMAAGVAVFGLIAVYFVGHTAPRHDVEPRVNLAAARYALRVLATGWGPVAEKCGPAEPTPWPSPLGLATAVLVALTLVRLLLAARNPADRLAVTGVLLLLGALAAIAVGIGYGRAAASHGTLVNRYVTLMAPVLTTCALAWIRFGPPVVAQAMTTGLFLTATVFAWPNAVTGWHAGQGQHVIHAALERDIYSGVPASVLADQYGWFLFPLDREILLSGFNGLRIKGGAPFQRLAAEPTRRDVPIRWRVDGFPSADADGWYHSDDLRHVFLTIDLTGAERFTGVRVRYSLEGESVSTNEAYWRQPTPDGERPVTVQQFLTPGQGKENRLWLGNGVTRFTIIARGQLRLRIEDVTAFAAE